VTMIIDFTSTKTCEKKKNLTWIFSTSYIKMVLQSTKYHFSFFCVFTLPNESKLQI